MVSSIKYVLLRSDLAMPGLIACTCYINAASEAEQILSATPSQKSC